MKKFISVLAILGVLLGFCSKILAAPTAPLVVATVSEEASLSGIQVYAIKQTNAEAVKTSFVKIAKSYSYVREKTNRNDGKEVEMFLKHVGLGKGFPWCEAFVQYVFAQACKENGTKQEDLARGAAVRTVYRLTKAKGTLLPSRRAGELGSIMSFQHGRSAQGHVAISLGRKGKTVTAIEGNTSSGMKGSQRDGNGVFVRERPVKGYSSLAVEGYLIFVERDNRVAELPPVKDTAKIITPIPIERFYLPHPRFGYSIIDAA